MRHQNHSDLASRLTAEVNVMQVETARLEADLAKALEERDSARAQIADLTRPKACGECSAAIPPMSAERRAQIREWTEADRSHEIVERARKIGSDLARKQAEAMCADFYARQLKPKPE